MVYRIILIAFGIVFLFHFFAIIPENSNWLNLNCRFWHVSAFIVSFHLWQKSMKKERTNKPKRKNSSGHWTRMKHQKMMSALRKNRKWTIPCWKFYPMAPRKWTLHQIEMVMRICNHLRRNRRQNLHRQSHPGKSHRPPNFRSHWMVACRTSSKHCTSLPFQAIWRPKSCLYGSS